MIYLNTIDKVSGIYFLPKGFLTYYKNNIEFYSFNSNLLWNKVIPGKFSSASFAENNMFIEYFNINTGFEETCLVLLNTLQETDTVFKNLLIRSTSNDNLAIALKYDSVFNEYKVLLNLQTQIIHWEKQLKYLPFFLSETYLVSAFKKEVIHYDLNGVENWVFNTSILGKWYEYDGRENDVETSNLLGGVFNQLYIYLTSGKILVLDSETGEQKNIIKNDANDKFDTFGYSIELDANNGKLIQLANQDLIEVDLHNNYTVTQTPIEDMKSLNLENYSKFVFDDDFIYFTDYHHCKIVSLNRKTLKIDWVYDFPQDHDQLDNPRFGRELKLINERLYVLDNKHTLHIFQKESHPA